MLLIWIGTMFGVEVCQWDDDSRRGAYGMSYGPVVNIFIFYIDFSFYSIYDSKCSSFAFSSFNRGGGDSMEGEATVFNH